jgi:hemoglobin
MHFRMIGSAPNVVPTKRSISHALASPFQRISRAVELIKVKDPNNQVNDPNSNRYTPVALGENLSITENEIHDIVHCFYKKVHEDAVLGPVFAKEMTHGWDEHLETMCNFWTSVMFGKSLYKGNPLEVHRRIDYINRDHFEHWLELFKEALLEVCPTESHVDAFYQRADKMARVMTAALSIKKGDPVDAKH